MPRRKTLSDADLLEAVLPVILETGIHKTTLAALGRAVGLAPATLLQRFGSKTALIEAALDRVTDSMEAERPTPTDDPAGALARWLGARAAGFGDRQRMVGSLELLGRDITIPERNAEARRYLRAIHGHIAHRLRELGHDAATADTRASIVEAQFHGLAIQWALRGDGPIEAWVETGIRQLLEALTP